MINLVIKKSITAFILPPGIFILLFILLSIVLFIKRKFRPALLSASLCILLWIFSIYPAADILLKGLESSYSIPKNPKGDVIVLLGGGVIEDAPDMTGVGAPSNGMYPRLVAAVRLHKMLKIPVIISGGKVFNKSSEAVVIKRFLTDLGVPASKILTEEESNDTLENALNTKTLMFIHGFKKPILLTSALHMRRAELCFKVAGVFVQPYPVGFKTVQDKKYKWHHFLPYASNMHDISMAMHEYAGFWFYKAVY